MSIKQYGGVFGRNPTFNDVTIEGDLEIDGTLSIGGSVITGLNLQGNWNASTNTPDLTALTPDAGQFWIVSVAGSTNLGGITNWTVGDWALYDGSAWQRIEGGTVDLSNAVTGTLAIANGGTGATTAANARTALGSGAVGDNVFTAATASAAQQAMDVEVGVDVQAYDATILKSADIGSTVQGYDADTAKYDDATANFTGTLQNGGSNVLVDTDIGSTVEAYDATILKSADIGSTVQGYDADTAKYDDTTANFTGTLQNGGSNVVVDTDIGSTVQAYDADTAKLDANQTWTGTQAFNGAVVINEAGADVDFRVESDTNANALFVDGATGYVGVGKSSPARNFVVYDASNFTNLQIANSVTGSASTDGLLIQVTDSDCYITNRETGFIQFRTSNIDRMRIDSSGNVGIGTTSPAQKLDVNGSIKASGIYLGGTGAANYLDDYEEGSASGTMTVFTATTRSWERYYRKMGNLVVEVFKVVLAGKTAGSGNFQIPTSFTPIGFPSTSTHQGGSIGKNTINTSIAYFGLYGGNPVVYSNSLNGNYISASSWNDGEISFTLIYFTA